MDCNRSKMIILTTPFAIRIPGLIFLIHPTPRVSTRPSTRSWKALSLPIMRDGNLGSPAGVFIARQVYSLVRNITVATPGSSSGGLWPSRTTHYGPDDGPGVATVRFLTVATPDPSSGPAGRTGRRRAGWSVRFRKERFFIIHPYLF